MLTYTYIYIHLEIAILSSTLNPQKEKAKARHISWASQTEPAKCTACPTPNLAWRRKASENGHSSQASHTDTYIHE